MQKEEFIRQLRDKGYKITPKRQAIIETLMGYDSPPSAREVLDSVRREFPDVSLDTVYRNLRLLADLGLVHQIDLRSRETSRFEIGGLHHHHLVCLGCGQSRCVDVCLMGVQELAAAGAPEFEVVGHAFEIYGYCKDCRKAG